MIVSRQVVVWQSAKFKWIYTQPSWFVEWNSIQEWIDLHFWSISPDVSISLSPNNSLRELWNDVIDPTINSHITLWSNPEGTITDIVFKRGWTTIHSWLDTSFQDTFTVATNTSYSVNITDSEWRTDSTSKTYSFVHPFFWWVASSWDITDWITETALAWLSWVWKQIVTKSNKTFSASPSTERFVFLYPASYWNITSIIDDNWFETISDYNVTTINITSMLDWTDQDYKFYELKSDTTQVNFTNQFKF